MRERDKVEKYRIKVEKLCELKKQGRHNSERAEQIPVQYL